MIPLIHYEDLILDFVVDSPLISCVSSIGCLSCSYILLLLELKTKEDKHDESYRWLLGLIWRSSQANDHARHPFFILILVGMVSISLNSVYMMRMMMIDCVNFQSSSLFPSSFCYLSLACFSLFSCGVIGLFSPPSLFFFVFSICD